MIGAVLFAYNNQLTDYLKLAAWSADNIRRHLNIPVAVITDKILPVHNFDKVIVTETPAPNIRHFNDYDSSASWYNSSRPSIFELTPWNETLLLDVDYVVASNNLTKLFKLKKDFFSHRLAFDLVQQNNFEGLNYFGTYKMPQWWATVMYFSRCKQAEMIFYMMNMIKNNWDHYRNLYQIGRSIYRNDYALSIALNTTNGHIPPTQNIPWSLATVMPEHNLSKLAQDQYRIEYNTHDKKKKYITISNMDFHAMGKKQLEELVESRI